MDGKIIQRLIQKDETGIQILLAEYGGLMKSVCHKYLYKYPHLIDECMNDSLVAIWQHANQYNPAKGELKNWLAAVTRYRAINLLKQEARHRDQRATAEALATVADQQQERLWIEELEDLLQSLTVADRQLFIDIYVQGYSPDQLADQLNISRDAVYQRLSRARKKARGDYHE